MAELDAASLEATEGENRDPAMVYCGRIVVRDASLVARNLGNRSDPTTADNGRLRLFRFDLRFYKNQHVQHTQRWVSWREKGSSHRRQASAKRKRQN